MKTEDRAQVLIVGSGAGGSATALELARSGVEVLVLEVLAVGGRTCMKFPDLAWKYGYNC